MIASFRTSHNFEPGDPVYAYSDEIVGKIPHYGPFLGYCYRVEEPGKVAVVIIPITVTTVRNEHLVIDPIKERRAEYQALGESYTKASDLAVCDYVNMQMDDMARLVNNLIEVVAKQQKQIDRLGKKRAKR